MANVAFVVTKTSREEALHVDVDKEMELHRKDQVWMSTIGALGHFHFVAWAKLLASTYKFHTSPHIMSSN